MTTSEVTTQAAATGQQATTAARQPQQQPQQQQQKQRAAAAGQPKTCDPFRQSPPSESTRDAGVEANEARAGRAWHAPPLHSTQRGAKRTASAHAASARAVNARAYRARARARGADSEDKEVRAGRRGQALPAPTAHRHKKAHVAAKAACAQTRSPQAAPLHFGVELADRTQAAPPHFGVELAERSQQATPPLFGR